MTLNDVYQKTVVEMQQLDKQIRYLEGKRDAYNDIRLDLFNEIERTQAVKENEE